MAFTAGTFSGLNRTDALAAVKAWIEGVAALRGFQKRAVTTVYDDVDALRRSVEDGGVHLAAFQSDEWLRVQGTCNLTPVFVPAIGESVYDQILLLVDKSAAITELSQLRDATVIAHNTAGKRLGERWLENELRARELPAPDGFFRRVETAEKPTGALLPVFFGKRPACIVGGKSFDTAAELNPQLRRRLTPLLVSPDIVGSVICVWGGNWTHKEDLLDALRDLHQSIEGQQILGVFRTERLVPYEPVLFQGVKAIADGEMRVRTPSPTPRPVGGGGGGDK